MLRQAVPLYPNYVYNSSQVNRAYSDLMALGYFKERKKSPSRSSPGRPTSPTSSPSSALRPIRRRRSTRAKGYLTCNILCTPTLKQSVKVDLEGQHTSSFYGLKATVGYQNRNIFRGAESFDLSLHGGLRIYEGSRTRQAKGATEFGVTTGLTFPRFLVPWRTGRFRTVNQPRTKVELSVNFGTAPICARTLFERRHHLCGPTAAIRPFSLRPIDINVIDMTRPVDPEFLGNTSNKYLINSFQDPVQLAAFSFGYGYNNQRKNLGGNATNIRFNAETAGNLIDAVRARLLSRRPREKGSIRFFGIEYRVFSHRFERQPRKSCWGRYGVGGAALRRGGDGLRKLFRPCLSTVSSIAAAAATAYAAGRSRTLGQGFGGQSPQIRFFRSDRAT